MSSVGGGGLTADPLPACGTSGSTFGGFLWTTGGSFVGAASGGGASGGAASTSGASGGVVATGCGGGVGGVATAGSGVGLSCVDSVERVITITRNTTIA